MVMRSLHPGVVNHSPYTFYLHNLCSKHAMKVIYLLQGQKGTKRPMSGELLYSAQILLNFRYFRFSLETSRGRNGDPSTVSCLLSDIFASGFKYSDTWSQRVALNYRMDCMND